MFCGSYSTTKYSNGRGLKNTYATIASNERAISVSEMGNLREMSLAAVCPVENIAIVIARQSCFFEL